MTNSPGRRSLLRVAALTAAAVALFPACDGGSSGIAPATSRTAGTVATTPGTNASRAVTPAATTGASSPAPATTSSAAGEEVRGIVGAVNQNDKTITIARLSGAQVTRIAVTATTRIRTARGGAATLAEIKSSDRIIATGTVDRGALQATEITVEAVVPGAAPGG